jgi:hypothetical protein
MYYVCIMHLIMIKRIYNVKRLNCKLITVKQDHLRIKGENHGTKTGISPLTHL